MAQEQEDINLSQLFDNGLDIYFQLEDSSSPTNSPEFQAKVQKAIKLLEQATEMVNQLELFSINENIDEIITSRLKYLLLPSLLGTLTLKSTKNQRKEILDVAIVYFKDFIERLNQYEFTNVKLNSSTETQQSSQDPSLESMALTRREKILRYNRQKEMKEKLSILKETMSKTGDVDDEVERDYYLTMIRNWIDRSLDEFESIQLETKILQQRPTSPAKKNESKFKPKPLKPIILTKTDIQKKVFGLGYPSIPTMTIDEFVNKKFEEGSLSESNPIYSNSLQQWAENPEKKVAEDEEDAAQKEEDSEKEDPIALAKARGWDEWKDDNIRGSGNRQNMG